MVGLLTQRWTKAKTAKDITTDGEVEPPNNAASAATPLSSSSPNKKKMRKGAGEEVDAEEAKAMPVKEQGSKPSAAPAVQAEDATSKRESKKARRRRHRRMVELNSKEPQAAAAYLQAWQASCSKAGAADGGTWKFNKATQAWLLRHAYETDKVAKDTFRLLLRYLAGLKGGARERLRTEAGAIVLLKGAPLAAPDDAEEEPKSGKSKRRRKDAIAKAQDEGEDGAETNAKQPELTEAEVKARKIRLRRAKLIVSALDGEDAAEKSE